MNFEELINSIESTHLQLSSQAVKQVNYLQTIRNWLIGCYIVEFEQNGEDRAAYGTKLLISISLKMKSKGNVGFSDRNLRQFRQFYLTYPQIWQTVSAKFKNVMIGEIKEGADKDDALVEYATAGLENELFISKYMLQLPDKQTLLKFIKTELNNQHDQ